MQRLLACLCTLVLMFALGTACGGDDDDSADMVAPTAMMSATVAAEPTAPSMNEDYAMPATAVVADGDAANGQALAASNGCAGCHSVDGSESVGPSWQGLYGSQVTLSDGSTVTADAAFITESIRDPRAKIVSGFQNVMPLAFSEMSDADIADIIAYIRTLK